LKHSIQCGVAVA